MGLASAGPRHPLWASVELDGIEDHSCETPLWEARMFRIVRAASAYSLCVTSPAAAAVCFAPFPQLAQWNM
jgi:hypothetical protein